MSINVVDDVIVLTNETYTFKDICDAVDDTVATELVQDIYWIKKSLFIGNKDTTGAAKLIDTACTVRFDGEYFQVHKGSELRMGIKRANGTTGNGVVLIADNLTRYYGFGAGADTDGNGRDPSITGNLYAYGCTINAWTFWSWFSGEDQVVEMIDCIVDGYGRVQGETSVLKNIVIEKSNGRYGILSPKGSLAVYDNLSVGATDGTSAKAAIYWNPRYAPFMRIVGGTYSGYDKLVYTEKNNNDEVAELEFIGTNVVDGFDRLTKDDKTNVRLKYVFNPQMMGTDGIPKAGLEVEIRDSGNSTVVELVTDDDGYLYAELTVLEQLGEDDPVECCRYVIVGEYEYEDEMKEFAIPVNLRGNWIGQPFYLSSGGASSAGCDTVDYDRIQAMFDKSKEDICECSSVSATEVKSELALVADNTRQMMLAMGDDIRETATIVKYSDGVRVFI